MSGARNLESIVDDIDEKDGADYGDSSTNDADTSGDSDAGDSGSNSDESANDSRNANDALVQESNRQQQPQDKQQTQDEQLRALPNGLLQDAKGNLIHPKTREVIATAGKERRLFERAQRQESFIARQDSRIKELETQIANTAAIHEDVRRLNLSNDDLRVALPIVGEFIKDPVNAAKKIVEMVAGMGHNLSEIFGGQDNIEMRAVSRLIDEKLAPLTRLEKEQQEREQSQKELQDAEAGVQQFFEQHEHAEMHAAEISALLGRRWEQGDESFTPQKAYYELQVFAARNGLDFSQPLKPQLEALSAGAQREERDSQPQQRVHNFPNGRGSPRESVRTVEDTDTFDGNADWADIIRAGLRSGR